MKVTDLVAFLKGELGADELQSQISAESDSWAERLSERGRSAPITLSGKIATFDLTRRHAIRILDALIKTELSGAAFAYIIDALLLSDHFRWTSEAVRGVLEELVVPEPGANIDMTLAWKARERLSAMTSG